MFMDCRGLLVLAVLSASIVACSSGPTPSVPEPTLTPDDLEVFAAVVNDTIRKPREAYRELLKRLGSKVNAPDPILVADKTLQTCEVYDYSSLRCADPRLMKCLSAYPVALQDRSRKSYRISAARA
jgi:hypothetical protein